MWVRVHLDRDLNAQLFSQFEDLNQYIDPDPESVAPVCDDEDMVANNQYKDFRTEIDDEFKELDFDVREHDIPSNTFTDLDMDVLNNVREHDPIVAHVVVDNTQLYKGMICQDKEMLTFGQWFCY